jgi:hypothetical protein
LIHLSFLSDSPVYAQYVSVSTASLIRVLPLLVCSALKGKHGDKANVYPTKCDVSNADDVEKLAQVSA